MASVRTPRRRSRCAFPTSASSRTSRSSTCWSRRATRSSRRDAAAHARERQGDDGRAVARRRRRGANRGQGRRQGEHGQPDACMEVAARGSADAEDMTATRPQPARNRALRWRAVPGHRADRSRCGAERLPRGRDERQRQRCLPRAVARGRRHHGHGAIRLRRRRARCGPGRLHGRVPRGRPGAQGRTRRALAARWAACA